MPLFNQVIHYLEKTVTSVSDRSNVQMGFWYSLTYAILAAAAEVADVRREEVDGLFSPQPDGTAKIVIYDNVPGGAGYSQRIANEFSEILVRAYELVESCSCDSSCYDCLRTYSNQLFHIQLDRRLVMEFLLKIVEQIRPDEELKAYGPGTHRMSLAMVADRLPALFRLARPHSILYLPQLTDTFNLNRGTAIAWLNLLKDAVQSMQSREAPLELIVHQLPEATSDDNRVFRKRLYQWIDQGILKLYQTTEHLMPIICLSSLQQNPIGLALGASSNGDLAWFQTRSKQGIEHFIDQLKAFKQNASPVSPDTLNDPDTVIIFPDPTWQNLSLEDLRQRLGLSQILQGSTIQRIVYSDRYLYKKGAKLLSKLLEGNWLDHTIQIEINTLEGRDEDINQRTITLETELKKLTEKSRLTLNVTAFGSTQYFPHARVLEVYCSDHQTYKVIFDKGVDFIGRNLSGSYFVKEPTYIVISQIL